MSDELCDRIDALQDKDAVRLLHAIASADGEIDVPPSERHTIQRAVQDETRELGVVPAAGVSEGALAKSGLKLLAADPAHAERIKVALRTSDRPSTFVGVGIGEVALFAAVVAVLRTSASFKRHADGTWEFDASFRPLTTEEIKAFLGLFSGWIGGGDRSPGS